MFSDEAGGVRKIPTQSRSRERQERILEVAETLIAEVGSEAMKMGDIAKAAGISIGSLYQYYRDKGAVLAALAERYHAEGSGCIGDALVNAATPADLLAAFGDLIEIYLGHFQSRPAMRDVWVAIQADKTLSAIELDATRRNAGLLATAINRVSTRADAEARHAVAFALMALGEATMRLAVTLPPVEARLTVDVYQRMAHAELSSLLGLT